MTTALVFGSKGFAGSYLKPLLQDEGMEVVDFNLRDGLDIRDYEAVRTAVEVSQPSYVFHLAAQAYVPETTSNPQRGLDVNAKGTLNILEAVRQLGSQARIHIAGTSEEYGYDRTDVLVETAPCHPTTTYGVSKLTATQLGMVYARTYGQRVVVTRAFNHTGPFHPPCYAVPSFAKRIAEVMVGKSNTVRHGNLEATRSYTDVRDVVRAYRAVIECDPGIYNVCSRFTVDLRTVLETLIDIAGGEIRTEHDDTLFRKGAADFPPASCDKLYAATGWEPEISLHQTLEDTLAYWKERV